MLSGKVCGSLVALGAMCVVVSAQAAIIMDATTHNGALSGGPTGTYWDNTTTNATEWLKTGSFVYNGAVFIQAYPGTQIYNNTGETVTVNHQYTLSADLGDREGTTIDVYVRATENSDGTGASVDLVQISRVASGNDTNFNLFTTTNTGGAAGAGLAGYYIQVLVETSGVGGQQYFFDNINVSSELVPEPGSIGLILLGSALALFRRRKGS